MKKIIDCNELTPIEEYHGILFKRDDLYLPYSDLEELGGCKVRQMEMLYKAILEKRGNVIKGLITSSSVVSPQGLIVAKIANTNKIPAIICKGGLSNSLEDVLKKHKTLRLAHGLGAEIRQVSKFGYGNALESKALNIANTIGYEMINFGINMNDYPEAIIGSIVNQVANIPDELDNLIIPCGSGVTMGGILIGLSKFNKKVKNIFGIQIAGYDRKMQIDKILEIFKTDIKYNFIIDKTYTYDKNIQHFIAPEFDLSVKYEAKSFKYFLNHKEHMNIKNSDKTMFWCIGNNNFIYE